MTLVDVDKWREIFSTLGRHKLRTGLTAFGVFWGIFMLTVLLGAGKGFENGVVDGFPRARNTIFIWSQGATQIPYEGLPTGRRIQFYPEDVEAIRRELNLPALPEPPDVADALAIALCHCYVGAKVQAMGGRNSR